MNAFWLVNGKLVTPRGIVGGAIHVVKGRIAAIRARAPLAATRIDVHRAFVAPGFLDLHVWGEPDVISRTCVAHGTTAFLTAFGPEPFRRLAVGLMLRIRDDALPGAACLGAHLEGPFLNPERGGVLPAKWMRAPTVREIERLATAAQGRIRLLTLAPELRGAEHTIRWCRRHGIAVSLGHSDADAASARRGVAAGASAVTHVFNGMRPLHHRKPGLLGVALTEDRLTTMVIADGVHVSPLALRLLARAKGAGRIALVTDSVHLKRKAWGLAQRSGAYYDRRGTLAGSTLTMIQAVRNMVRLGGATLIEAVRMATDTPARVLGVERSRGALAVGRRADVAVFDQRFRVTMTIVNGAIVYQRGR